jgi:hypothetical protein
MDAFKARASHVLPNTFIWSHKIAYYCLWRKCKPALCTSIISDEYVFDLPAAELAGTAAWTIPHIHHDQCQRFPPHNTEMHHKSREKYQGKIIFHYNSIHVLLVKLLFLFFRNLKTWYQNLYNNESCSRTRRGIWQSFKLRVITQFILSELTVIILIGLGCIRNLLGVNEITDGWTNKNEWLLTYLLTELSPSCEATFVQPFRKFPAILRNPKVHHRVHKSRNELLDK